MDLTQYSLDWHTSIYGEYSRLNELFLFVHLLATEFNEAEISMAEWQVPFRVAMVSVSPLISIIEQHLQANSVAHSEQVLLFSFWKLIMHLNIF